jgi:hypothetical protein
MQRTKISCRNSSFAFLMLINIEDLFASAGLFSKKITNMRRTEGREVPWSLLASRMIIFIVVTRQQHFSRGFKWWLWRPTCALAREVEKLSVSRSLHPWSAVFSDDVLDSAGVKGSSTAKVYAYCLVAELRCNFSFSAIPTASVFFFGCAPQTGRLNCIRSFGRGTALPLG